MHRDGLVTTLIHQFSMNGLLEIFHTPAMKVLRVEYGFDGATWARGRGSMAADCKWLLCMG